MKLLWAFPLQHGYKSPSQTWDYVQQTAKCWWHFCSLSLLSQWLRITIMVWAWAFFSLVSSLLIRQLPRSTYFLCPFPTSLHALHLTDSPLYSMSLGDICCLFDFLTLIVMTWYLSNPLKFMHIFKKYVLRIYYRLGTLLGIGCVEDSPYPLKTLRWVLNAVREPPRGQWERDRVGEAFSSPWGCTWEDFPEERTMGLGSENFLSRSLWG